MSGNDGTQAPGEVLSVLLSQGWTQGDIEALPNGRDLIAGAADDRRGRAS